jgi:hypothetical protein
VAEAPAKQVDLQLVHRSREITLPLGSEHQPFHVLRSCYSDEAGPSAFAADKGSMQQDGGGKKVDIIGITAFLMSIGAWFTTGIIPVLLFAAAAGLAALSMKKISKNPERYALKTLSFVALIIALLGFALYLYSYVLILFS